MEHYKEVVEIIFRYIALAKETPPQGRVADEIKNVAEILFRFSEKTSTSNFTSGTSTIMRTPVPREWLLSGLYLIRNFDTQQFLRAMGYFPPDNFHISIASHKFPGDWDQREK